MAATGCEILKSLFHPPNWSILWDLTSTTSSSVQNCSLNINSSMAPANKQKHTETLGVVSFPYQNSSQLQFQETTTGRHDGSGTKSQLINHLSNGNNTFQGIESFSKHFLLVVIQNYPHFHECTKGTMGVGGWCTLYTSIKCASVRHGMKNKNVVHAHTVLSTCGHGGSMKQLAYATYSEG